MLIVMMIVMMRIFQNSPSAVLAWTLYIHIPIQIHSIDVTAIYRHREIGFTKEQTWKSFVVLASSYNATDTLWHYAGLPPIHNATFRQNTRLFEGRLGAGWCQRLNKRQKKWGPQGMSPKCPRALRPGRREPRQLVDSPRLKCQEHSGLGG